MIKWYSTTHMSFLPKLQSPGDLTLLLTTILSVGMHETAINNITYDGTISSIELGEDHGFVAYSVIKILNSEQPEFNNKEFRILKISTTSIYIVTDTEMLYNDGISVIYPPLGWSAHYNTEYTSYYRSTDPRYPAYLRVDDTPYSDYDPYNYIDASVEICAEMSDFNSAVWQAPYDIDNPDKNRKRTSIKESWFIWTYAYNPPSDMSIADRNYIIYGDETSFWILLAPYKESNESFGCYGMPLVDTGNDTLTQCLVAGDLTQPRSARYGLFNSPTEAKTCALFMRDELGSGVKLDTADTYTDENNIVHLPVFCKINGKYVGIFKGMSVAPSTSTYKRFFKSNSNLYLIRIPEATDHFAATDTNTRIILNLGEL